MCTPSLLSNDDSKAQWTYRSFGALAYVLIQVWLKSISQYSHSAPVFAINDSTSYTLGSGLNVHIPPGGVRRAIRSPRLAHTIGMWWASCIPSTCGDRVYWAARTPCSPHHRRNIVWSPAYRVIPSATTHVATRRSSSGWCSAPQQPCDSTQGLWDFRCLIPNQFGGRLPPAPASWQDVHSRDWGVPTLSISGMSLPLCKLRHSARSPMGYRGVGQRIRWLGGREPSRSWSCSASP